ncbi:hypothetical protein SeMB42_g07817, partial [Synchytrium endobioticum]
MNDDNVAAEGGQTEAQTIRQEESETHPVAAESSSSGDGADADNQYEKEGSQDAVPTQLATELSRTLRDEKISRNDDNAQSKSASCSKNGRSVVSSRENDDDTKKPMLDPSKLPALPSDHLQNQSDTRNDKSGLNSNNNDKNDGTLPIVPTMDIYTIPPDRPDSPHDHEEQQEFDLNPDEVNEKVNEKDREDEKYESNKDKDDSTPRPPSLNLSAISRLLKDEEPASTSSCGAYEPNEPMNSSISNGSAGLQSAILVNSGDKVVDVSAFQSPLVTPQIINHEHDGVHIGIPC